MRTGLGTDLAPAELRVLRLALGDQIRIDARQRLGRTRNGALALHDRISDNVPYSASLGSSTRTALILVDATHGVRIVFQISLDRVGALKILEVRDTIRLLFPAFRPPRSAAIAGSACRLH